MYLEGIMLREIKEILYVLTYMGSLKNKNSHKSRDQTCAYQKWKEGALEEDGQKAETSSYKTNKY